MAAFFLHELDERMERTGLFYVRFLTAVMMKLGDDVWVNDFIADCFERG